MRRGPQLAVLVAALTLSACGAADTGARPAVEVKTVTVYRDAQRPCAAKKPERPGKLVRPLPTDTTALAALLGAKLTEYDGSGKYADRADAAIDLCTKPTP